MIQAAVNPETGEFMGLIIPKDDLSGGTIAVYGQASDWERIAAGEQVDPNEAGVVITPRMIEAVQVDNFLLPNKGGN